MEYVDIIRNVKWLIKCITDNSIKRIIYKLTMSKK